MHLKIRSANHFAIILDDSYLNIKLITDKYWEADLFQCDTIIKCQEETWGKMHQSYFIVYMSLSNVYIFLLNLTIVL